MKDREVDILIVVDMFLTGFDATTLNTLWVDKNLRQHGLIQAFSRTNRILNSVKTYGNIVCFRNLEDATNKAIGLFVDKDAEGIVLMKKFEDYYNGYEENGKHVQGYAEIVQELEAEYPLGVPIIGEQAKSEFIKLFGKLLRIKNILSAFDQFADVQKLSDRDMQDYQSIYIDTYDELRPTVDGNTENINDDLVFELELIKQVEINIDYILMLIEKYHKDNCNNKEIRADIEKAIGSSPSLRSKKDLIMNFVDTVNVGATITDEWKVYVNRHKEEELNRIIVEEKLKPEETIKFINNAFQDGVVKTTGTDIDKILPPMPIFGGGGKRTAKKKSVIEKLKEYFERFFGLI